MWTKCIQCGDMLKKDENCKILPVGNVDNFLEAPKWWIILYAERDCTQ